MPSRRPRTLAQLIWDKSPAFARVRAKGVEAARQKRLRSPKCGAKTRVTGEPCQQAVSEPGKRCRYHGGATPKGDQWHRRQAPKRGAAISRLENKMKAWEVRDRQAEERRAEMTPEERAAHEERRKPKRPGSAAERVRAKNDRETKTWLQDLLRSKDKMSGK